MAFYYYRKADYVTVTPPYVELIAMIARALTLTGADGVLRFSSIQIGPYFSKLT